MLLETLVMEEMLREWLTLGHGRLVAGLVIAAMLLEVPGFVAMLYWEVGVYVPPTATGTPAPNTGSLVTVG
jgi:hypothetical protein